MCRWIGLKEVLMEVVECEVVEKKKFQANKIFKEGTCMEGHAPRSFDQQSALAPSNLVQTFTHAVHVPTEVNFTQCLFNGFRSHSLICYVSLAVTPRVTTKQVRS